jgi:putative phage-type endonuclease
VKTETIFTETKAEWLQHRLKDVTSTEVAALFGISPYLTKYELWHNKKNQLVSSFDENERMKWGTRLQESIAKGIGEDNGWKVEPLNGYERIPDLRIGSSFDFFFMEGEDLFVLEIKNVDSLAFKEGWLVDGEQIEAPPHIEIQVQQELLVSGAKAAYIGALVGGNRIVLLKREPQPEIFEKIKKAVADFWQSIEDGIEPEPDFKRDSAFIITLLNKAAKEDIGYSTPEIDELAQGYKKCMHLEKTAKEHKQELKAKILMQIGLASKVMGDNYTISAGEIKPTKVEAFEKKGYRNFKVNFKGDEIND